MVTLLREKKKFAQPECVSVEIKFRNKQNLKKNFRSKTCAQKRCLGLTGSSQTNTKLKTLLILSVDL